MDKSADRPHLRSFTAMLGRELCRPLDRFEAGLARLLREPPRQLTQAERDHALMMLQLCEDLRTLTRESLGTDEPDELSA